MIFDINDSLLLSTIIIENKSLFLTVADRHIIGGKYPAEGKFKTTARWVNKKVHRKKNTHLILNSNKEIWIHSAKFVEYN